MVLVKKEEKYIYIRKDEGLETQNRPRKKKRKKKNNDAPASNLCDPLLPCVSCWRSKNRAV